VHFLLITHAIVRRMKKALLSMIRGKKIEGRANPKIDSGSQALLCSLPGLWRPASRYVAGNCDIAPGLRRPAGRNARMFLIVVLVYHCVHRVLWCTLRLRFVAKPYACQVSCFALKQAKTPINWPNGMVGILRKRRTNTASYFYLEYDSRYSFPETATSDST